MPFIINNSPIDNDLRSHSQGVCDLFSPKLPNRDIFATLGQPHTPVIKDTGQRNVPVSKKRTNGHEV